MARNDRGAMLVLALVLMFAISIALVAIVQMAGASFLTTGSVRNQRTSELNAENAATTAIQYVRGTYTSAIYQSPPQACLPPGVTSSVVVYCIGTNTERNSVTTRDVQFFACPSGTSAGTCTTANNRSTQLYAEVVYDDVIASALPPNNNLCGPSSATTTSCGLSMSMRAWDVRTADN